MNKKIITLDDIEIEKRKFDVVMMKKRSYDGETKWMYFLLKMMSC